MIETKYSHEYPGYLFYSDGRIFNESRRRFLNPWSHKKGLRQYVGIGRKDYNLDSLIYSVFHLDGKPIPEDKIVKHRDGDFTNNALYNLELEDFSIYNLSNQEFKEIPKTRKDYKTIPCAPDYKISSDGEVINSRGMILKTFCNGDGYETVGLVIGTNNTKSFRIHRLVYLTHVLNSSVFPDKMVIDHLNGIKNDNRVENLELITYEENSRRGSLNNKICRKRRVIIRKWETKEITICKDAGEAGLIAGADRETIVGRYVSKPEKVYYGHQFAYYKEGFEFPEPTEFHDEVRKAVYAKNIVTGEEMYFPTSAEAARTLGYAPSHISTLLSTKNQPMLPNFVLIKTNPEEDWRLVLDPIKEKIENSESIAAFFAWDGVNDPLLFLELKDAVSYFSTRNTTIHMRLKQTEENLKKDILKLISGYYWIYYKDVVVYKPFELRETLDKYLVPTSGSDAQEGVSNQNEKVKSKIIETIRSQDVLFDNYSQTFIQSKLHRRLSKLFNNIHKFKNKPCERWNNKETFIEDAKLLPGFDVRDLVMGRIKFKVTGNKNDMQAGNLVLDSTNCIWVRKPEYNIE